MLSLLFVLLNTMWVSNIACFGLNAVQNNTLGLDILFDSAVILASVLVSWMMPPCLPNFSFSFVHICPVYSQLLAQTYGQEFWKLEGFAIVAFCPIYWGLSLSFCWYTHITVGSKIFVPSIFLSSLYLSIILGLAFS